MKSLGAPGVLQEEYQEAGFRDAHARAIPSPLRMPSAAECVRFERESFGALHQMLSSLDDAQRTAAWEEIEQELRRFEDPSGFEGPCELVVGGGTK